MCADAVHKEPQRLQYASNQYKSKVICNLVMRIRPASVFLVSDCFKNEETRILNHFRNQVMCDNSVCGDSHSLKYIPDWSAKEKLVKYNIMMLITIIFFFYSLFYVDIKQFTIVY